MSNQSVGKFAQPTLTKFGNITSRKMREVSPEEWCDSSLDDGNVVSSLNNAFPIWQILNITEEEYKIQYTVTPITTTLQDKLAVDELQETKEISDAILKENANEC